jgi:hypothetical protein
MSLMTPNPRGLRGEQVAAETDSQSAIFEEVHALLNDGLKSCRNVVANYRAMLTAEGANDNSGGANDNSGKADSSGDH